MLRPIQILVWSLNASPFPSPYTSHAPSPPSPPSFLNQPHPTGGWALWGALSSQLLKTLSGFVSEVYPLPWQRDCLGWGSGLLSQSGPHQPHGHTFPSPPSISALGLAPCLPVSPWTWVSISPSFFSPNAQITISSLSFPLSPLSYTPWSPTPAPAPSVPQAWPQMCPRWGWKAER